MKKIFALILVAAGLLTFGSCVKYDPNEVHVDATCYCDYYNNGTTNYVLMLQYGSVKKDGEFRKAGEAITLDMIAPGDANRSLLPEGTYTLDVDGNLQPGDLVASVPYTMREYLQSWIDAGFSIDMKDYSELELDAIAGYNGTAYYRQTNRKDGEAFPVEAATATITRNGKEYQVSITVTVGGEAMTFSYEGPVDVEIEEPEAPATEGFTAYYYGDYYNVSADNWVLRVLMSEREALYLDLLKEKGTINDLPEGTFMVSRGMVPGDLISGVIDQTPGVVEGTCVGDWSGHLAVLVDNGSVEVIPGEGTMRVNYTLSGSDLIYGGEREGTFTGTLTVIDGTQSTLSMLPPHSDDNFKFMQYGSKKTLPKAARAHDRRRL